jgi:hypothetical protein
VLLKRTLSPGLKLLRERLVEAADRAGAGSDAHQGLGDFSYLVSARPGHEHLRQPFGDMGSGSRTGITARQPPKNCTCTFRRIQLKPSQGALSAPGFVTFRFW